MGVRRLITSFRYAWRGIVYALRNEHNFQIQSAIAIVVLLLSSFFQLRKSEVIVILLLIAAVLILELLNTAFETFVDLLKPRLSSHVRMVKDIMAAAVLLTSVIALIIGCMIFWPHIVELFFPS